MKYRIEIFEEQDDDIVIRAKEKLPILERIERLIEASEKGILGYTERDITRLEAESIDCFFIEASKVYAIADSRKWQIRERLYQLEERFSGDFVKINQSCLIRMDRIERFHTTLGGALQVILKNGYKDYVSRRQLKEVKERMGI